MFAFDHCSSFEFDPKPLAPILSSFAIFPLRSKRVKMFADVCRCFFQNSPIETPLVSALGIKISLFSCFKSRIIGSFIMVPFLG